MREALYYVRGLDFACLAVKPSRSNSVTRNWGRCIIIGRSDHQSDGRAESSAAIRAKPLNPSLGFLSFALRKTLSPELTPAMLVLLESKRRFDPIHGVELAITKVIDE